MAVPVQLLVAVACTVAVVAARAPQARMVKTDALPNNIMDALVSGLVYHFTRAGQGQSLPLSQKTAQIPYSADNNYKFINIKIAGELKNFQQIRRAGSAKLDVHNNELRGTISIDNAEVAAYYQASFPASGAAPANTARGRTSMTGQVFCDMVMHVDQDGKPITITSMHGRVGWRRYNGATGLYGNRYGPTYHAAFQDSLRILMKDMCEKTVYLIAKNDVLAELGVEPVE